MWEYLGRLREREGITVFFTTHYMDEADRNADKIAIIDHGSIIASGTGEDLKRQMHKGSLEDAFLELTGRDIREEGASGLEHLRMMRQARGR
jgi:ABC-2 type transport system ATP-binding protein